MPVIQDATVVGQAYDISGNGGRKLIRLKDGTLVSAVRNGTTNFHLYKSTDNGKTWAYLVPLALSSSTIDVALATNGAYIFALHTNGATIIYFRVLKADGTNVSSNQLDSSQTSLDKVSLAINEAGTELHATWASKNAAYPNSFNIRYAKGTINADGNVTWGAVEQLTKFNATNSDSVNPSIALDSSGKPIILYAYVIQIRSLRWNGSSWDTAKIVYEGGTYAQSSPSAIFVPQRINGLPNGRIFVAWHGKAPMTPNAFNISYSFSDDGGVTWGATYGLTSSNTVDSMNPSVTAGKDNKLNVLYAKSDGVYQRQSITGGSTFQTESRLTTSGGFPSALFDLSMQYSSPLFIYRDTAKVGFYGSGIITEISIQPTHIGEKTDKSNLLTYTITSDGAMTTITEKVNGVVVGTKTATSGQELSAGLSKDLWDAVKYGRYSPKAGEVFALSLTAWENGTIESSVGNVYAPVVSGNEVRTKDAFPVNRGGRIKIGIVTAYRMGIFEYDAQGKLIKYSGHLLDGEYYRLQGSTEFIRFIVSRVDGSSLTATPANISAMKLNVSTADFTINTLSIEMGPNKWEYTFDKHLPAGASIVESVKAVQDTHTDFLPGVKSELIEALQVMGADTAGVVSWKDIESAIKKIPLGKKYVSGTVTSSSLTKSYIDVNGETMNSYYVNIDMTLLPFVPDRIIFYSVTKTNPNSPPIWSKENFLTTISTQYANHWSGGRSMRIPFVNGVMEIPVTTQSHSYTWTAYKD